MKIKLTEGQINTPLVIAVGILAAIMVMGIGSHAAFAASIIDRPYIKAVV